MYLLEFQSKQNIYLASSHRTHCCWNLPLCANRTISDIEMAKTAQTLANPNTHRSLYYIVIISVILNEITININILDLFKIVFLRRRSRALVRLLCAHINVCCRRHHRVAFRIKSDSAAAEHSTQ